MQNSSSTTSTQPISLTPITTYQAGIAQAAVHRRLQQICDTALAPFEITKMQWMLIGTVLDAGEYGIRISDIAQLLSTTIPYITTSVTLLESKGMLSRVVASDKRSKVVVVAPLFHARCRVIEQTLRDALRKTVYATIDPTEFRIYMKVLYQLNTLPSAKS